MAGKSSAYSAMISNVSERDGAKDVEQFDDIVRTFANETNKFETRFGKIRDEETMVAVKKLMFESLLNFRFRGTTMWHDELLTAMDNVITDKVSAVPTARSRKIDRSALNEIGITGTDDGENSTEEGDQRITDIALQAVHKGSRQSKL